MDKPNGRDADAPLSTALSEEALDEIIRIRAYQKWVQRGCPPDNQQQDWFDAEAECLLEHHLSEADPALLRSILNNTTAVVYAKDLQGRYLLVNRRYEMLFKVSLRWLLGRTDFELFSAEIAKAVQANDRQVLAAGVPIEFEEQVTHDDGLHTYISLKFPIFASTGEPYAVCGISTDITERQKLTRRRAAEHAVTRALAEASNLVEATPRILPALSEVAGFDVGTLWYADGAALACVGSWSNPHVPAADFERACQQLRLARGEGLPGRVWQERSPLWINDPELNPGLPRARAFATARLRSAVAVAVREQEEVTGVLEFFGQRRQAYDQDLVSMLDAVGRQIGMFVQRKRVEASLQERTLELQLARRIQQGFFPKQLPELPGIAVAAESRPALETGGDYVDFVPLAAPRLGLAVGDVSGHGVGSALLMALTRAYLRAYALSHQDPSDIFRLLNRSVAGDLDPDHFVTLFFATLDTATGALSYANAGHLPGYVIGADGAVTHTLDSTSFPLGLDADGDFSAGPTVQLEPGDLVFVLTDGIPEAFDAAGTQYGLSRALAVVRACRAAPPPQILAELFRDVRRFAAGQPQLDDRSALLLTWRA